MIHTFWSIYYCKCRNEIASKSNFTSRSKVMFKRKYIIFFRIFIYSTKAFKSRTGVTSSTSY
nr:MAG TPA: hypothetical protein [Bacteriophage sp.]